MAVVSLPANHVIKGGCISGSFFFVCAVSEGVSGSWHLERYIAMPACLNFLANGAPKPKTSGLAPANHRPLTRFGKS